MPETRRNLNVLRLCYYIKRKNQRRKNLAIRLGDEAPDFTAETTEGTINFHEWMGDGWAIFFSHPKDYTPVCTTELGTAARIKPEFEKRNVKMIALSVDPLDSHVRWAKDIEETQGTALNFPVIADRPQDFDLYDMIHPNARIFHRPFGLHRRTGQKSKAYDYLSGKHRAQFR